MKRVITTGRKGRTGFTLIELLVVIAIIAILAAILFPVFARTRQKAQQTTCLSNVKQITLAFLMYAADHDGGLPPAEGSNAGKNYWWSGIVNYIKNPKICSCPVNRRGFSGWSSNYAMNRFVGHPPWGGAPNIDHMSDPVELLLIADSGSPFMGWDKNWSWYGGYCPGGDPFIPWGIHFGDPQGSGWQVGTANCGFMDGHAEARDGVTLSCVVFPEKDTNYAEWLRMHQLWYPW